MSNTKTSISIDREWDIIPEPGDRYAITQWSAETWLVKDNLLADNPRGIWFYCGGTDVAIVGNQLMNNAGIWVRTNDTPTDSKRDLKYNAAWKFLIEGNLITNTNGKLPSHITIHLSQVTSKSPRLSGTGISGIEVRHNQIEALVDVRQDAVWNGIWTYALYAEQGRKNNGFQVLIPTPDEQTVGILGTIVSGNTVVGPGHAYYLGRGVYQTVIKDVTGRGDLVKSGLGSDGADGATGTVVLRE